MNKNAGAGRRTGNHKLENKGVHNSLMRPSLKSLFVAILLMSVALVAGCNLRKTASASSGGSGPTGGPFTIGGTVSGLASGSTGLVLKNNATDSLTISGNGTFTFKTAIVKGQAYSVSVSTP